MTHWSSGSRCCVPGCESRNNNLRCPNVRFHTFPQNPERAKNWVKIINRPDLLIDGNRQTTKNQSVCSKHFESRMYNNPKDRKSSRLLPLAFPTLGRDFSHDASAAYSSLCTVPTLRSGNLSNNELEASMQQTLSSSTSAVKTEEDIGITVDTSMLSIPTLMSADLSSIKQEEPMQLSLSCSTTDPEGTDTSLSSIPIPMSSDLSNTGRDDSMQLSLPCSTSDVEAADTAVSSIPIPIPMSTDLPDTDRDEPIQLFHPCSDDTDEDEPDTRVSSIPIPMSANVLNTNREEPMQQLKEGGRAKRNGTTTYMYCRNPLHDMYKNECLKLHRKNLTLQTKLRRLRNKVKYLEFQLRNSSKIGRSWDEKDMENAIDAVQIDKMDYEEAAEIFGVPKAVLMRREKENTKTTSVEINGEFHPAFPENEESELVRQIQNGEKEGRFYGITAEGVRYLAYRTKKITKSSNDDISNSTAKSKTKQQKKKKIVSLFYHGDEISLNKD